MKINDMSITIDGQEYHMYDIVEVVVSMSCRYRIRGKIVKFGGRGGLDDTSMIVADEDNGYPFSLSDLVSIKHIDGDCKLGCNFGG